MPRRFNVRNRHQSRHEHLIIVRIGLIIIRALHFLPLALLSRIGAALGMLLYALARARRHVVQTNLKLCFPELTDDTRRKLARKHFRAFGRSLLEHGILWWGSKERVRTASYCRSACGRGSVSRRPPRFSGGYRPS